MGCLCIVPFFKNCFRKRRQRSIQRQAQKDAQIKVDAETKLNTEMNARSEAITEPRPMMREITEEEYEIGVINYREHEPITITVNDVHGVTHIQDFINFNPPVPLNEVSNPDRIETMGKELSSGSQEIVELVENNHTPTKELSDRENLQMGEVKNPAITKELSDRENLQMGEVKNPAITKESSDKESLEMIAIDMDGKETRITWRGIITPERRKSNESMH